MNAAEKALVAALHSGNFKQGRGKLMKSGGHYCCLGVACRISDLGRFKRKKNTYVYIIDPIDKTNAFLPYAVRKWLKWSDVGGELTKHGKKITGYTDLTSANDDGVPFSTIASWIEKGYIQKEMQK